MFIPLKMVLIGIDPYPYVKIVLAVRRSFSDVFSEMPGAFRNAVAIGSAPAPRSLESWLHLAG
jgi:hypothetical protein